MYQVGLMLHQVEHLCTSIQRPYLLRLFNQTMIISNINGTNVNHL